MDIPDLNYCFSGDDPVLGSTTFYVPADKISYWSESNGQPIYIGSGSVSVMFSYGGEDYNLTCRSYQTCTYRLDNYQTRDLQLSNLEWHMPVNFNYDFVLFIVIIFIFIVMLFRSFVRR